MASVTLKALDYYEATFTYTNINHAAYIHMWCVDRIKPSYDEDDIGNEACAAARGVTRFFFTESDDINSSVKTLSSEMKATLEAYNAVHPTPSNKKFDARLIYYTLFKSLGYPVVDEDAGTWTVRLKDYTPDYASSILTPIYVTNLSKAEIIQRLQGSTTNSKLKVFSAINSYGTLMPLFERTYQEVTSYYMLFHVNNFEYYFDPAYDANNNIDSWPLNLTTAQYDTLKGYASISGQEIDFDNWANYLDKENANDNGNYLLVRIESSSLGSTSSGKRIINEYWNTFVSRNALLPESSTSKIGSSGPVKQQSIKVKILYNTYGLIASSQKSYFDILHELVYNSSANAHPYEASAYWACYKNKLGTYTHILEFNYGTTSATNNSSYTTTVLRTYNRTTTGDKTYDTTLIDSNNNVLAIPMSKYNKTELDQYDLNDDEVQEITDAYNDEDGDFAPAAVFDSSETSTASNHSTTVLYCTVIPYTTPPALSTRSLYWYSSNINARYNQFFLGMGNDCVSSDYPNMLNKLYGNVGNSVAATTNISSDGVNFPTNISNFASPDKGFCKIIFTSDSGNVPLKLLILF